MAISEIEWTEETINPTMGCSLVSPGCEHCYAMRQAYRLEQMGVKGYEGTTKKLASGKIVWTGKINFDISKLERAVRTKTPTTFFVDSMSDLFHEKVTFSFIAVAYEIMMNAKQHSFQILTKRIDRALEFYNIAKSYDDISNIWLGTSVEDQERANERIHLLLQTPAKIKWLSIEPLLGKIILHPQYLDKNWGGLLNTIDWVVVGGESGPKARPMNPDWVRKIRDDCVNAKVPFFFKQWGGVHKKENGRILDGREWNEYPKV